MRELRTGSREGLGEYFLSDRYIVKEASCKGPYYIRGNGLSSGSSQIYRMIPAITMSPTLVHKIDSVPHAACTNAPHWFERHNLFMTFSVRCLLSQLPHEVGILMSLANVGASAESPRTCLQTHIFPVTALVSN